MYLYLYILIYLRSILSKQDYLFEYHLYYDNIYLHTLFKNLVELLHKNKFTFTF